MGEHKEKRFKGWSVVVLAAVICGILLYNIGNDRYSTTYIQSDFRQVYLEDYSGTGTTVPEYIPQSDTAVTGYIKGPLNLFPGLYSIDFQYAATDETSVLKIFASDYLSEDNSGGVLFLSQPLAPTESAFKATFALDQRVDSLFILVETRDSGLQIGRITTQSSDIVCTDTYFGVVVTLLLAFGVLILLNLKKTRVSPALLNGQALWGVSTVQALVFIMAGAVAVASLPVLNEGLLAGHDLPFHMARIDGIASGLQSGQFPVRIHGETLNNYGYPNSLFYPELLMYFPALLRLAGVSTFTCYKFYIVFINGLAMAFAYVAFTKISNNRMVGLAAGIVYVLNPYRLICAFYRSAMGEFTALSFLPLVLYGLYAVLYGRKKDWFYLTLGATGVLQSHILTSEMTVLLAAILCALGLGQLFGRERRIIPLLCAAGTTLLLNAWFLGPMLLMMSQLGLSVFGRGFAVGGASNTPYGLLYIFNVGTLNGLGPHPIGWISLFAVGFYILYRIINKKDARFYRFGNTLAWLTAIFTIATTPFFPWSLVEKIPVLGTLLGSIQFSYRCLSIAQVCAAILAAFTILLWFSSQKSVMAACVAVVSVAVISALLFYEFVFVRDDAEMIVHKSYYQSNMGNSLSVGQAEYLVEGSNLDDMVAQEPIIRSNSTAFSVTGFKRSGTVMRFNYTLSLLPDDDTMIILPVTYIPNYRIEVNGVSVLPVKYEGGRVAFTATAQQGNVTVAYREPLTFRIFELISVFTLVCWIWLGAGIMRRFRLWSDGKFMRK